MKSYQADQYNEATTLRRDTSYEESQKMQPEREARCKRARKENRVTAG